FGGEDETVADWIGRTHARRLPNTAHHFAIGFDSEERVYAGCSGGAGHGPIAQTTLHVPFRDDDRPRQKPRVAAIAMRERIVEDRHSRIDPESIFVQQLCPQTESVSAHDWGLSANHADGRRVRNAISEFRDAGVGNA